ncbi:M24 family metallopeptidase [Roseovarius sp.]|uniref:M24 family metallopeptidase n=1 Tax=Roseovarius sp. TaxID=1486281 RepID=UPI003BAD20EE
MKTETHEALPFPDTEYQARVEKIRTRMRDRGLDALLICVPQNYYYLTGFITGCAHSLMFLVFPLKGDPLWITRKTEMSNVRALAPHMWAKRGIGVADSEDMIAILAHSLRDMGLDRARLGIEKAALFFTIAQYEQLTALFPDAAFHDITGLIEHERRVKSPRELDHMRKAGGIASRAVEAGYEALQEGVADSDLAAAMLSRAIREGGDRMGMLPFVSAGSRSYCAHASWVGARIGRGEIVNAELAGAYKAYHVPIFRVFSLGQPSDEILRMQAASEAGLHAGLDGIRAGMTSHEADSVVRRAIEKQGYGENFVVRAAYGLGVAIAPGWGEPAVMQIMPEDQRVLESGMCFHLVPAIYVEGIGCVCCSMPLIITETGIERLTDLKPELLVK